MAQRAQVIDGAQLVAPSSRRAADIVAVFLGARREIALRFVIVARFGQTDIRACLDRRRQDRGSDTSLDARAQRSNCSRRRFDRALAPRRPRRSKKYCFGQPRRNRARAILRELAVTGPPSPVRVSPRNRFEQDARIGDAARDRTGMVETFRKRHHACHAHKSERRLQPDDPAKRRGNADRSARIGAHGCEAHSRGDGRRRSSARAPGNSLARPGIARAAEVRVLAGDAVGELVHVGLAEKNRSGPRQPSGHVAVSVGNEIRENLRAGRGANAARPEIVLQRNGNAVQRAARAAPPNFPLGGLRLAPRTSGEHREKRIEAGIAALDARERRFDQIERRNFLPPQQARRLLDRKKRQLGFGASRPCADS